MLKASDSDNQIKSSTSSCNNTQSPRTASPHPRESGYGTDFSSPLSTGSPGRFAFGSDLEENVFYLSQDIENTELNEDVFSIVNERIEDDDDSKHVDQDATDKEVEDILTDSGELYESLSTATSAPIDINPRPTAPVPGFQGLVDSYSQDGICIENANDSVHSANEDSGRYETDSGNQSYTNLSDGPDGQRSISTQTPPGALLSREAGAEASSSRSEEARLVRGRTFTSLRLATTGTSSSLPDAAHFQRNRSASFPVVEPLRQLDEQTMGRTLRRISDEFEAFHRERRRKQRASSLPLSVDLWKTLRQYLSHSNTDDDATAEEKDRNTDGK